MAETQALTRSGTIQPGAVLELLKPVTWFAPVWAFVCGAVSAGAATPVPWVRILFGMLLAGPLVCGASQALNDWCDRDVDRINQPDRPIPSGRLPGRSGLWIALGWSALSIAVALLIGPVVALAAALALLAGWAYSAPPLRLKGDGWAGPALTGLSYEGLAWITGALVVGGTAVLGRPMLLIVALLYSLGAHGIMTLNDFKAVEGDRATGVRSLPVQFGTRRAAQIAAAVMIVPQLAVAAVLAAHAAWWSALAILLLVVGQLLLLPRLVRDPEREAPRYNGTGVLLYVIGMMVAAGAIRLAA